MCSRANTNNAQSAHDASRAQKRGWETHLAHDAGDNLTTCAAFRFSWATWRALSPRVSPLPGGQLDRQEAIPGE